MKIITGKANVAAYLASRGGPTSFGAYITPEEARDAGDTRSLGELKRLAGLKPATCMNCSNPVWRFAGVGLCFSCTTGEADASKDSELISTWTPSKQQRRFRVPRVKPPTKPGS